MSVLKQELNYSTYQNKLMSVLDKLEDSFRDSLTISKSTQSDMRSIANSLKLAEKALSSTVYQSARIDDAITALTKGFIPEFEHSMKNVDQAVKQFNLSIHENIKSTDNQTKSINSNTQSLEDSTKANKRFQQTQEDTESDMRNFNKGLQLAADIFAKIGSHADEYSHISNNLIQISGMQGDIVKDFRSDMMSVVADLNKDTGSYYNPQQAYAKIAATMQGVTGNLEAMQEMARPVLLASEALDVNISSIATLFNRFYTRYNFSAMSMEAMVGDIRKYSAGSAATGEDIVAAQHSLQVLMEYYAKGDEQKLVDYNEQIAKMVGFYENSGFDPNLFLVDLIKEIEGGEFLSGDTPTAIAMQRGGMSIEDVIAASSDPFNYDELANVYLRGVNEIFKELEGSANRDRVLSDVYGLDSEIAMDINNFLNRIGDLDAAFDKYVDTRDNTPIEEIVEDKYVSAADKTNNWLEQIYAKLASIQETTGIGFSDIALLLSAVAGAITLGKSLSAAGGIGEIFKSTGRGGRSILQSMTNFGRSAAIGGGGGATGMLPTAANSAFNSATLVNKLGGGLATGALGSTASGLAVLGGGAAGAALGIDGAIDAVKSFKDGDKAGGILSSAQALLGGGGAVALGALGATNPVGWALLAAGGAAALGKSYKNRVDSRSQSQSQFIESLKKANLTDAQRRDILSILQPDISDTKIQKKITKSLADGRVSSSEFNDILYGGINKLFDTSNLLDKPLSAGSMKAVAKYLGWDDPATDDDSIPAYADGTNYVSKDKLAIIHEGEAITPKKYNPAANMNELERLREQSRENQNRSSDDSNEIVQTLKDTAEILTEIRVFLSDWKADNIRRETTAETRNKFSKQRALLNGYL